jgi:hypothetical protein
LLDDDSIVVRPSDKSSGVVIMNRSDYETEVHDELKENGPHKEIKEDLTITIENKIKTNVEGMTIFKILSIIDLDLDLYHRKNIHVVAFSSPKFVCLHLIFQYQPYDENGKI